MKPYQKVISEMLAMLLISAGVGFYFFPSDPFFLYTQYQPYWLWILLISIRYGAPYGLLASLSCAAMYMGGLHYMGYDMMRVLHLEMQLALPPVIYIILGTTLDGMVQHYKGKIDNQSQLLEEAYDRINELGETRLELDKSYRVLEGRLAAHLQSLETFSKSLEQLNGETVEDVFDALIDIVKKHVGAKRCGIWALDPDGSYVAYRREEYGLNETLPKLGAEVMRTRRTMTIRDMIFANRSSRRGDGLIAAPLFAGSSHIVAVIVIQEMDFSNLQYSAVNQFDTFVHWASKALQHVDGGAVRRQNAEIIAPLPVDEFICYARAGLEDAPKDSLSTLFTVTVPPVSGDPSSTELLQRTIYQILCYNVHRGDAIGLDASTGSIYISMATCNEAEALAFIERAQLYVSQFEFCDPGSGAPLKLLWSHSTAASVQGLQTIDGLEEKAGEHVS
ncbi:MAG: hypothetical protein EOL87_11745 [Spartobacteria bacterium]|nr:hypothetical protein [Spartobacteria bacterium]